MRSTSPLPRLSRPSLRLIRCPGLSSLGAKSNEVLLTGSYERPCGLLIGAKAVSVGPNSEAGRTMFATTHWSVVVEAGRQDSPGASQAMAQLCEAYWYPLYAYVRRKGYAPPDAQDLTQEFFARLLAGNYVGGADRRKGKFRSFLLATFEHFLAKEWRRAQAQKRGGGKPSFSLDAVGAENRYLLEPADEQTAERIFDRHWADTLLSAAMARLQQECQAEGKARLFEKAEPLLPGGGAASSYAEIAASLTMSESAFKMAVHRLRRRYGELVREQIAQTVSTSEAVEEELRYLFAVLRQWQRRHHAPASSARSRSPNKRTRVARIRPDSAR
jgi:RNA polymerase sigma factor (sigma-70 family)